MKLNYVLLFLSLLPAVHNFAQTDIDITALKNNKVKSVTCYLINVVESKVEEYLNTPSWYKQNIIDSMVYDNKGKMVLRRLYDSQNRNKYYDIKYEYNSAGLVTKATDYDVTTLKTTENFVYNKDNFLTYHKLYNNLINYLHFEYKIEYTLKKGKLPVETRTIDSVTGRVNIITVKTFDVKDQLTEEVLYMGSKEIKNIDQRKKYYYHNGASQVVKEIQTFRKEQANPYFVQKYDNSGFLLEAIFFDPYSPGVIKSKTTYTKDNNRIIQTNFDLVKEERLPASSGNADETAPLIHGEPVLKPVHKRVTILSKNGLHEIVRYYTIDYSGNEKYDRGLKYDYTIDN